jgi:rhodanese-related sulfurtransferase
MALKLGYKDLIADAMSKIDTLNQAEAMALLDDPDTLFVDIRDVRELEREGMIPNAFHAPRGMLEFWVDPDSPYYKPELGSGKR